MNFIERYKENELFKASLTLLVLVNIANLLNYALYFIMGRWLLSPADYGTYALLINLIYIFGVPASSIQTLVAKYTTAFNIKREYGKIKGMLKFMVLEAGLLAMVLFLLFCLCSFFFYKYVGISFFLLIVTGLYIFGAFLSPIGMGIIQGMKKFSVFGWNTILNSTIKIIVAVVLVLLGFKVYGAILGFILGTLVSFIFIFPFIKEVINSKEIAEKKTLISLNSLSILMAILIITFMYSLDIILAKIFFPPELAGKYAIVSTIGKMIFFATSSLGNAMFPISSERFLIKNKEKTLGIIKKTFFIITVMCLIALFFIGFFPKLIINVLFGAKYTELASILIYVAIAFSMISLTNTLILYKISIEEFKIKHAGFLFLFLIFQIVLFIIFKKDLYLFSIAFAFSATITFLSSILFLRK